LLRRQRIEPLLLPPSPGTAAGPAGRRRSLRCLPWLVPQAPPAADAPQRTHRRQTQTSESRRLGLIGSLCPLQWQQGRTRALILLPSHGSSVLTLRSRKEPVQKPPQMHQRAGSRRNRDELRWCRHRACTEPSGSTSVLPNRITMQPSAQACSTRLQTGSTDSPIAGLRDSHDCCSDPRPYSHFVPTLDGQRPFDRPFTQAGCAWVGHAEICNCHNDELCFPT
jgi:hypothetical protein